MVATASCVTAMGRGALSRPGSGLSRSVALKVRDRGAVGAEERIRFTPGRVVRRTLQRQVGDRKSLDYCMTIVPNSAGNSCLQTGLCRTGSRTYAPAKPRIADIRQTPGNLG